MRKLLTASVLLFLVLVASPTARAGEDTPSYTRFLVPLYTRDTPGAYGSLWQVRTWLRYGGTEPMRMVPAPFCFGILCSLAGNVEPGWPSVPFQLLPGFFETAILVHVESEHADEVTFESRVRDLSRASSSAGTEVPVVREDRMPAGPVYLLNVPVEPKFRQMLRVYALPDVANPEVEVRYYRQPSAEGPRLDVELHLLRVDRVRLRTFQSSDEVNLYPALAEVGNIETFPEVAAERTIWVEVRPITPGLRIWALLSITNNETQQVTIISPNR